MIYQLGQVSNRDIQVLYFYRILRHASTNLGEIYRYDNPDVFILDKAQEVQIDEETWYEYHLDAHEVPNRIPYLEFLSEDEVELKHIEDLVEVEVTEGELVLRGHTDELTDKTSVAVYWVPSLDYIARLQKQIEDIIGDLRKRAKRDADAINKISVNSDYLINLEGVVPNLVNIGADEEGLIYDDSHYMLSGSVGEQTIVNPPQSLISGLLKSHTGTLTVVDMQRESRVYQGFYGGVLRLSGSFRILVLRDITSIIYLNNITADRLIIENCPAVIFRQSIEIPGYSTKVTRLELRNSYVTVNQRIDIESVWCYRMSTLVLKEGKIQAVGFVEAGSSLVYDTPSANCEIEDIRLTRLQGLFYASNLPDTMPYLDEVFFAQKPIAFQRGQVEDPLPISQAEVSIYLNHSGGPGPGPGPSPSGKIYSPFTDWYWSGDSRTVQLIAATGTDGKGYDDQALEKLIEVQAEIESEGVDHNIMLWWGVSGLDAGAPAYADVYKSIANNVGDSAKVFVGTIGHCPNGSGSGKCDGGEGQDLGPFNQQIEQFNEDLKTALSGISNVVILDVAKYIKQLEEDKGASWLTQDNLHYLPDASKAIYDWVCDQITNVEPGYIPDAPTDTHAGVIWNWLKNAGIANVSNRPELIAAVIGNFQQESYVAIDVLGDNGSYCGPWCESNRDFRSYVINQGFTFHPYTVSPGDDSAAIPAVMTWLTQYNSNWALLARHIDDVTNQTGVSGAESFAELFAVCVERCIGGSDGILDPGVQQVQYDMYIDTEYEGKKFNYQALSNRRQNAANIYTQFMGL